MTKLGRPPIPKAERQNRVIVLRVKAAEYKALEAAAQKSGLSVSEYMRRKLKLRGEK
jgi:uncharacterized protein (DUF1778 family)